MDEISTYNSFLALHKHQLELSNVPELFWRSACKKIADEIVDADESFKLLKIDYNDGEKRPCDPDWALVASKDIDCLDANHIYVIDHMWTFQAQEMVEQLQCIPDHINRMCDLLLISAESDAEKIKEISKRVWKYAQTYSLADHAPATQDRVSLWYIHDEVGCGIIHSNNPNFRAVPLLYAPRRFAYTLLFPIKNVKQGETVSTDFLEGVRGEGRQREAMLIPWQPYSFYDPDMEQYEPSTMYFLEGHMVETLPKLSVLKDREINTKTILKVYSEYKYVNDYLTFPSFEIVDNEQDADILWYLRHFHEYKQLSVNSPHKFVNQFPFEYVITTKDLLAVIGRRHRYNIDFSLETEPLWLPTTFNMKTEFHKLATYYDKRRKAGLDNYWICKPYNLARGLDTYITDNLDFMCRLPLTGPKVAQLYITDPVLFNRPYIGLVKFDIRYVILLTSVNPTRVFIYNNFFLRFANKPFSLDDFEDYEKHFTVMNYTSGPLLFKMLCNDFKEEWSKQFVDYDWKDIEESIFEMFVELFANATAQDAPRGIARSPQSRALYAADVMLSWRYSDGKKVIQPKLLEINWMPDCRRACEYYPSFFNDIFNVMFFRRRAQTCTQLM